MSSAVQPIIHQEFDLAETLLATKFYKPPALSTVVNRQHLLEKLELGLEQGGRLTLVSAPAGYGKTTLLGEWIRGSNLTVAWLSLDEGDNDPARFLVYLISALRKIIPDCGEKSLAIQATSPGQNPAFLLTPLVNDMANHPSPFLVVLDDYHLINNQTVHASLTFLLENAPPQAHFVITTRADPLLPIPRLRGRGQVTEIRQSDLRFSENEAAQFLRTLTGLSLGRENIAALNSRTEGWAAGLRMAAASLQDHPDVSTFIADFTGSNRYILDYLIEEVLDAQPEAIQGFLLHTSILEQLCASLCDAVTDQLVELPESSQSILESLERRNLFIFPLDENREWYRYHRLFADLLKQRLSSSHAEIELELHHRASVWYEQNGFNEFAIDHALLTGDEQRAALLIEGSAESTLMKSQVTTLNEWLQQISEQVIQEHPELSVYYAWTLLLSGAPLEAIQARLESPVYHADHSAKALPLQAFLAIFHNQIDRSIELARLASEQLPEEDMLLRSLANYILASGLMAKGKTSQAIEILEEIGKTSQRAGNLMIAVLVLCELADLRFKEGHLREAQRLYQQALEIASDPNGQQLPVAGKALIGLGDLAREWNDLAAAEKFLLDGIALAEQWSVLGIFEGYISLVMVWDVQGKKEKADQMFTRLSDLAYQFDASELDDYVVEMFAARRNITQGDLAAARGWADHLLLDREKTAAARDGFIDILVARLNKYENMILGRLLMAEGHYDEAIDILNQVISDAERSERIILLIEAETQRALALQASNRADESLEAITRALRFAEPEGLQRIFIDQDEPLRALLTAYRGKIKPPALTAYVDQLLTAFEPQLNKKEPSKISTQMVFDEPLSERELQVLQLLPSDLSSTEMAGELSVSVNTLRTHLKNIYAKLGAHSRYEAIARARDKNLL